MAKIEIRFKYGALYKLRSEPGVRAELEQRGRAILAAANNTLPEKTGYRMSSSQGARRPQGRWRVNIYTSSNHAKRSNARHNTLIRLMNTG